MKNKSAITALLAIVGAAALGGGVAVAVKVAVREADPIVVAFFRSCVATIVIFPLFLFEKSKFDRNIFKIILLSLFNTGNLILFATGIAYTTATASQVLYTFTPVIALVLSYFLLREAITKKKILSIVLGMIGVYIIIFGPFVNDSLAQGTIVGNIIIFLAVISFSIYTVVSKKFVGQYSPVYLTTIFSATSIVATFAVGAQQILNYRVIFSSITTFAIIIAGVGATIYFVLYQYAIKRGSPLLASMTLYLQPATAFVWGFLFLAERLTINILIGAAFAFTAAYLATKATGKNIAPVTIESN